MGFVLRGLDNKYLRNDAELFCNLNKTSQTNIIIIKLFREVDGSTFRVFRGKIFRQETGRNHEKSRDPENRGHGL